MTKKELIAYVAGHADTSLVHAGEMVDATFEKIADTLIDGEDIHIPVLGNFKVKVRAAKEGRNPATGEAVHIPAKKAVTFKMSAAMKESLNAPRKKRSK